MGTFSFNGSTSSNVSFNTKSLPGLGVRFDISVISLIGSNLITMFFALTQRWDFSQIMHVYWIQSLIIGFFYFRKILDLKNFSTEGFTINDRPVAPTIHTKRYTAFFFLFHYGGFHLTYGVFLFVRASSVDMLSLLVLGLIFLFNHWQSYRQNKEADSMKFHNIGTVMFLPYVRVLPMHLAIQIGSRYTPDLILVCMILKTIADVVMHLYEHRKTAPTLLTQPGKII
jgi:hypothetical protein